MHYRVLLTLLFITGLNDDGLAQKVDNTAFHRNIVSARSLRLHYENDYFSRSDIYYTQGINLEYFNPALHNYFRRLFVGLPNAKTNYGMALEHLGFTPTTISSASILYGDRPFAACLIAKAFSVSTLSDKKIQLSSAVSLGIIGPGAGGKQFQSAIHRWINDRQPMGWNNQIANDIILNYNISAVKGLVNLSWLTVGTKLCADAGTLNTKVSGGFVVTTGLLPNHWDGKDKRNFNAYLYAEPMGSMIGYDATLQGGLFNDSSPYVIPVGDVSRLVFQNNSGVILVIKKLQLEYFQSVITKEFTTGRLHHWGGVRLSVKW